MMDQMKMEVLREEDGRVVLRCPNATIRRMMDPAEAGRGSGAGNGSLPVTDEILEALEDCFPPEESTPMPGEPGFHWGM